MTNYIQTNIIDLLDYAGEDICQDILSTFSNTLKKKISKFSQYDPDTEQFMMPIPLIAQLGKNFNPALPFHMTGSDLLHLALKRVFEIERLIGGKRFT